jgi:hypothetical protein
MVKTNLAVCEYTDDTIRIQRVQNELRTTS